MPGLQEWIHNLEEGAGSRTLKLALAIIAFVTLGVCYDFFCYKNFWTQEAMDSAQLARNISEGKGYTTQFIRPLSIHLLEEHHVEKEAIFKAHPDLANPPVYPVLLAGLLKILPVEYVIPESKSFYTYAPELWITAFNQVLFLCAAFMLFLFARRFFDQGVALVSTLVFVGADIFWRFSISGISTMFLVILFLALVWCLALLDQHQADENSRAGKILGLSVVCGVLVGLAGLTRYSFLWLIFPVLVFAALLAPRWRVKAGVTIAATFLVIVSPWIVRNCVVSGTPFGTAGYTLFEEMTPFPEDTLQRSMDPASGFDKLTMNNFGRKFAQNIQNTLNDFPRLGGSWVAAFFLVGLLVAFRNPTLSRLRLFIVASLAVFLVVQAGSRTKLSDISPDVNSENLLVIFAPLVFVYGVAFYFTLLDQTRLPFPGLRQAVTGLLVVLASAQLLFTLAPPKEFPAAYPPYWPPLIQHKVGDAMNEDELMMSDIPWAVAWYGRRQCAWLTLDYDKQFFAIHERSKPVRAIYLTPVTIDSRFRTEILSAYMGAVPKKTWGRFVYETYTRVEAPNGFPLQKLRADLLPEQIFLADRERWQQPPAMLRR